MDKKSKIQFIQKRLAQNSFFDVSCFDSKTNVFIKSEDTFFEIMTFGKQAIFIVNEQILDWCIELFQFVDYKKIMDGENLFIIESKLREFGKKLAGEQVKYAYLKQVDVIKPEKYTYKLYHKHELEVLKEYKQYRNALNFKNDVIAIAAFDKDRLVALAGADDVLNDLWQIGIDTHEDYRGQGLATYLVKTLAEEIEKLGRLPYYTTWSLNLASTKVALNSGFRPTWISYYSVEIVKI